jgi:hypothetical protein
MGNESGKQDQKEETPENQAEEIQKDEIPPDTQLNKQYLENSLKNEDQDRKNIIIKEKHYENNEDGIHTKVDERRVEYHISKVNQDNDENVESAENIEYDENAEQMEDNAEGEYEMNQQEEFGEEGYQGGREYINEQINDIENKDYANYPNNFVQGENYSKIVINKSSSSNAGYTNKNIKISGNSPNILIETGGYKGRHTASSYSDIPRYMSFQKAQLQGSGNIRSSLNVVKTEDQSELIEIPKSEYASYAGRETVFIGGGMETGEYKFKGQGIIITQKGSLEGNVEISEEEILKEINRRKNKPKKEKRKKYEILDKFYAVTEYEGKPIYKTEKMEQMEKQYEYNQQHKYSDSAKGSAAFHMNSGSNIINDNNNAQMNQMQFSQFEQSHSQSESQNINNSSINYSLKYKNLDTSMQPSDNFSKALFSQINKIRSNPQSYINFIENSKKNIMTDKKGRLIYNGTIKIALTRGEQAFDEAIDFLKKSKSMEQLVFNPYLTVEMPKTANEIKYKNDLRYKVEKMINKGIIIKSFWRDVIRDPEISFLMMMVDDTGEMSGMRRKDLLDPNMKYIGINAVEINGSFVCYITLCPKE